MKLCSILSVVFALLAAAFWAWSSIVNVPVFVSGYGTLVTVMKDGSTVPGQDLFFAALKRISVLNAAAAGCAFVSALTQALTLLPRK
jgi:hypothetical protein